VIKASCIFSTLHEALAAVGVPTDPQTQGVM
jgi:SulP family sulfate permease